jgi:phosphate/sulfate permease
MFSVLILLAIVVVMATLLSTPASVSSSIFCLLTGGCARASPQNGLGKVARHYRQEKALSPL